MKKLIKKVIFAIGRFVTFYWREIALGASLLGFVTIAYYFTFERPEDRLSISLMILGMMVLAAGALVFFRMLWRKKWKNATAERLQRVFERLQRIVERVSTRLGFYKHEKKSVLEGKTKIIFEKSIPKESKKVKNEAKPPKWSKLQNNRDRVRYLYRGMASDKIRRGERIYRYETPNELLLKQEKGSDEERLIEVYVSCRYDERKIPDSKTVAELKRKIDL